MKTISSVTGTAAATRPAAGPAACSIVITRTSRSRARVGAEQTGGVLVSTQRPPGRGTSIRWLPVGAGGRRSFFRRARDGFGALTLNLSIWAPFLT
jgi:hypothetical protein